MLPSYKLIGLTMKYMHCCLLNDEPANHSILPSWGHYESTMSEDPTELQGVLEQQYKYH